jgi:hypothetical protein
MKKVENVRSSIRAIALSYIGKEDTKGNSGFKDELFEKEMIDRGWPRTHAWCAYFAELVYFKAIPREIWAKSKYDLIFSGSAVQSWRNFKLEKFNISDVPRIGDLVVWQNYKNGKPHWTGHMGIVIEVMKDRKTFASVEGNTNDKGGGGGYIVWAKDRKYPDHRDDGLNLLGFISPINSYYISDGWVRTTEGE